MTGVGGIDWDSTRQYSIVNTLYGRRAMVYSRTIRRCLNTINIHRHDYHDTHVSGPHAFFPVASLATSLSARFQLFK
jgi:hypothetical protein